MKITRKMLSVILALLMIVTIVPITASAATSGTCGDNLTWSYDESTYTLTISGTGAMEDYDYGQGNRPWEVYKDDFEKLVIENGVASISENAFAGCWSLENVTIANTVKFIGCNAFDNCYNIDEIIIPNSVKLISDNAFANCYGLLTIVIPDSVITIGSHAFWGCDNLKNVIFGESITSIGDNAFAYCSNLDDLKIPDSVVTIGSGAFISCINLNNITIGNSVTTIGGNAFYNCLKLESVTIPNSVITIGDSIFKDCSNLKSIVIGNGVTNIGSEAFRNCTSLESIIIPNNVTDIGAGAFVDCSSLKSVSLSSNIESLRFIYGNKTSIQIGFFENCSSLETVYLPEGLTNIEERTFANCTSLKSIVIPDSVSIMGYETFAGCENLESVEIGSNLKTMNDINHSYRYDVSGFDNNFVGCFNLKYINVDENNNYYSTVDGVLFDKNKTKLLHYPIEKNDSTYYIPDTVRTIIDSAFNGANNLNSIIIPDNVTLLGFNKYYKHDTYPSYYYEYGYVFANCKNLKSIIISGDNLRIETGSFQNCTSLSDVVINNSVTDISSYAFDGCSSLKSITISDSIKSIAEYAFKDCLELSDVCYSDTKENWNKIDINSHNEWLIVANKHFEEEHSHSYTEWITTESGCGETTRERTCYLCEKVETEGTEGSHEFSEWNYYSGLCEGEGTEYRYCYNCGKHEYQDVSSVSHDWSEWNINVKPTYNTEGIKQRVCYICNTTEKESIPMLEMPKGDVNGDGKISAVDSRLLMQYICGIRELTQSEIIRGDTSKDEMISVIDTRLILQYIAGLNDNFDCTPGNTPINSPEITLYVSTKNFNIGDVITIMVNIPENSGLSAVTGDICFNSNSYKPISMEANDSNIIVNHNYENGKARFGSASATKLITKGIVCTLTLQVVNTENTNISLDIIDAIDDDYDSVSVITNDIVVCSDHSYTEWEVIEEANCYIFGYETRSCINCGHNQRREIPLTSCNYIEINTTLPTCLNKGFTTYMCSYCESCYDDNYVDATGHNYTWYTISVATCETDGVLLGECSACEDIDIKATPKTGHNYVNGVCVNCTGNNLGESTTPSCTIHSYTWETIVEASCTKEGVCIGTCSVCQDTFVDYHDATGHNMINGACENCDYTENVGNEDDNNNNENNNDNNNEVTDPSDDCGCNCHKSGISNFFFKFALFFQKLFGSNKECACGIAHY